MAACAFQYDSPSLSLIEFPTGASSMKYTNMDTPNYYMRTLTSNKHLAIPNHYAVAKVVSTEVMTRMKRVMVNI